MCPQTITSVLTVGNYIIRSKMTDETFGCFFPDIIHAHMADESFYSDCESFHKVRHKANIILLEAAFHCIIESVANSIVFLYCGNHLHVSTNSGVSALLYVLCLSISYHFTRYFV